MKVRHAVGVEPESKTMITLGVRELDGSPDGHRRFYGNKSEKSRSLPKEACRNSPSGSSQVQEFAGSPSEHRWRYVECSPEKAIDAPEQAVVNVLRIIVVSM